MHNNELQMKQVIVRSTAYNNIGAMTRNDCTINDRCMVLEEMQNRMTQEIICLLEQHALEGYPRKWKL